MRGPTPDPERPGRDPYEDPEFREWAHRVTTELVPKLRSSAYLLTVLPSAEQEDDISPKFCVELGCSIMMNKPIIAGVQPGTKVPPMLAMIASRIVEWDHADTAGLAQRIKEAMEELDAEEEAAVSPTAPVPQIGELRVVAAPWVPKGTVYVATNADGTTPAPEDIIARIKGDV